MAQIMLDLETFGTRPGAAIWQIGACEFDLQSGRLGRAIQIDVDPGTCQLIGLGIDAETVKWWMQQSQSARARMANATKHVSVALNEFSEWVKEDSQVWGNGAGFDQVLLREAYLRAGRPTPWQFWNDRCFRTIKNLYGVEAPKPLTLDQYRAHGLVLDGDIACELHVAAWDSIVQAHWLLKIFGKDLTG
jgi:exodeoxyribonuclease VIII